MRGEALSVTGPLMVRLFEPVASNPAFAAMVFPNAWLP